MRVARGLHLRLPLRLFSRTFPRSEQGYQKTPKRGVFWLVGVPRIELGSYPPQG